MTPEQCPMKIVFGDSITEKQSNGKNKITNN